MNHRLLGGRTQFYPLPAVDGRGKGVADGMHTNFRLDGRMPAGYEHGLSPKRDARFKGASIHTSRIGFTSEAGPGLWNVGHSTEGGKGLNTLMSSVFPFTLMVPKSRNSRPCDALCRI
jgi:hypothetical protein